MLNHVLIVYKLDQIVDGAKVQYVFLKNIFHLQYFVSYFILSVAILIHSVTFYDTILCIDK